MTWSTVMAMMAMSFSWLELSPVLLAVAVFIGESTCLFVFYQCSRGFETGQEGERQAD